MLSTPHRVLIGLIIFIILVFIGQFATPDIFRSWRAVPWDIESAWSAIRAGDASSANWQKLSTLLTAALLHKDVEHILFNMLFLWIFAGLVGELLGTRWMLVIFFVTAICGFIGDLLLRAGSTIPSLGASGAVMGFEGAYLGLAVRWSLPWPHIWPIAQAIPPMRLVILAVAGFLLDISGVVSGTSGTAYGAHLGGFLAGLFLTSFVAPAPQQVRS